MLQQGVMFGGEGPIMEGTWYNLTTGDSFTVRDTFFEDNELIVQTMDGRTLKYSTIQNYVKSDKPIDMSQIKTKNETSQLPPEVADLIETDNDSTSNQEEYGILEDDMALITGTPRKNLGSIDPLRNQAISQMNTNNAIITKALSKRKLPELNISADWDFPEKEIDMLINIMEISKEEIVKWYLDNMEMGVIAQKVKEYIQDYLDKHIAMPEVEEK